MRRIAAIICVASGIVLVAIPTVYNAIYFAPYKAEVDRILRETDPEHRGLPEVPYEMALLFDNSYRMRSQVMNGLWFSSPRGSSPTGKWHFHQLAWQTLIPLHYSDEEIFALWCHYLLYRDASGEYGNGLNPAAQAWYGKNLSELERVEVAYLVAAAARPGHYTRDSQILKDRVERVLSRDDARGPRDLSNRSKRP